MLKFKIINSPEHVSRDTVLKLGSQDQEGIKFPDKNLAQAFILGENAEGKEVGGAYLHKKPLSQVHEDLYDLLGPIPKDVLWECSSIHLEALPPSFLKSFLQRLYETFVEFGEENCVNFIIMRLSADTYTLTKSIGDWPYVVELLPSADGFFYGILPLKGSQYEAYHEATRGSL